MRVVPQAFYQNPHLKKILADGLCSVIYKRVTQVDENRDRYLAAHALTLVQHGSLKITTYDGQFLAVGEGELIFLPKGLYIITDRLPRKRPFEALVCFFDDELLATRRAVDTAPLQASGKPFVMEIPDAVKLFTRNLLDLYDGRGGDQRAVVRPKLLEILHLLEQSRAGERFGAELAALHRRGKKSLPDFMWANYSKPLKIEDYAYLTGRSISTFHRDFKACFGASPKRWLIDRRLERARSLLQEGQGSVAEVAQAAGYENVPHFIKSFRKRFGITPGQFSIQSRIESAF
ncbi:MAG: AraC family transcriptional regulator [Bacteroidota bacterium]